MENRSSDQPGPSRSNMSAGSQQVTASGAPLTESERLNTILQRFRARKIALEEQQRVAKSNEEKLKLSGQLAGIKTAIAATEAQLKVTRQEYYSSIGNPMATPSSSTSNVPKAAKFQPRLPLIRSNPDQPSTPSQANKRQRTTQNHPPNDAITDDAIRRLHNILATAPRDGEQTETPDGITTQLLPHQKRGLHWLLWREYFSSGGILADDMGLGKTLEMIALIVSKVEEERKRDRSLGGTLIICPSSLLRQWEAQLREHCKEKLEVEVYHGTRDYKVVKLPSADVVLTTYGIIEEEHGRDGEQSIFRTLKFIRVVLDEAHVIKNKKNVTTVAVKLIQAEKRWAMTGTPVHNMSSDLHSLLEFLRATPFDKESVWKKWIDPSNLHSDYKSTQRMDLLIKSIMLRRLKSDKDAEGNPLISLPKSEIKEKWLSLSPAENDVYQKFLEQSGSPAFDKYMDNPDTKGKRLVDDQESEATKKHRQTVMVQVIRLRQIACHAALLKTMLTEEEKKSEGIDDDVKEEVYFSQSNPAFHRSARSTKVDYVIRKTKEILEKTKSKETYDKVIIVSEWKEFLHIIRDQLASHGIKSHTLAGGVTTNARQDIVDKINLKGEGHRVLLLSLHAGGVGLNLVGANHMFIMEPSYNPQLEQQAYDRIRRIGQNKETTIYRLLTKNTPEVQVDEVQKRKSALAEDLMRGTKSKKPFQLTNEELEAIFRPEPRDTPPLLPRNIDDSSDASSESG